MSIKVALDRRTTGSNRTEILWHPGDTVTGTVTFSSLAQIDIKYIQVDFEGRMKTKLMVKRGNSTSVNRGEVWLFRYRMMLFEGPYTMLPTTRVWPFKFQIPTDCKESGFRPYNPMLGGRPFSADLLQPLPPSMDASDPGLGTSKYAYVSYQITASYKKDSTFAQNHTQCLALKLQPYRREEHRYPPVRMSTETRNFIIKSLHLDPSRGDRDLSFTEKMKSTFNSSSLPSVAFSVTAKMPDMFISGQSPPIVLSLGPNADVPTDTTGPVVELKRFTVTAHQKIDFMVRGGHTMSSKDKEEDIHSKILLVRWNGSLQLTEELDLMQRIPKRELSVARMILPTFRSLIISTHYDLKFEAEIECGKERSKFVCKKRDVTILQAECFGDGEMSCVPASEYGEGTPSGMESDILPTYQAALKN